MRRRLGVLLTSTAVLLLSFQNCGKSNFASSEGEDILTSAGVDISKNTEPTAFEVGLDMISYNSCVPNTPGAAGHFTMKASAGGSRGGIRLDENFMQSASSMLRPIFGNSDVLDVQYKTLIEETNPEAEVQLALRSVTDYRAFYAGSSRDGIWGANDFIGDDSWLTPLVDSARRKNNAWVAYSNRAPSSKARLDFSFNQAFTTDYWSNLLSAQAFRNCLNQGCDGYGNFVLAAGFSEPMDRKQIRGPAATSSDQIYAYGRGYRLGFGYPDSRPENGMRVLDSVQEFNMATQNPIIENGATANWTCTKIPIMSSVQRGHPSYPQTSSYERVAISDTETVDEPLCTPMNGSWAAMNFGTHKIDKIREVLPAHQWQLGTQTRPGQAPRLCAVPVGFDCYPNVPYQKYLSNGTTQPYPYYVAYNNEHCINEDNLGTELSKTGAAAPDHVCGHYITVCTKQ